MTADNNYTADTFFYVHLSGKPVFMADSNTGYSGINLDDYRLYYIFISPGISYEQQMNEISELRSAGADELVNLVFHYIHNTEYISSLSSEDIYKTALEKKIYSGDYGNFFKENFGLVDRMSQNIILHYMYKKEYCGNIRDYFEKIVSAMFSDAVFYYDEFRKVLYVCTTDKSTEQNQLKYRLCSDMFRSIFTNDEIHWETSPVILNSGKSSGKLNEKYINIL